MMIPGYAFTLQRSDLTVLHDTPVASGVIFLKGPLRMPERWLI